MLQYNITSWHFRLVLYVFGKNFFTEPDTIDAKASEKALRLIFTRKPKVVNFCPYCRAVLFGTISLPFVYIWRKLPHKPKKEKTREEIMKSLKIKNILVRSIAGGINISLGIGKIFEGEYGFAILQITIGLVLIFVFQFAYVFSPGLKILVKFFEKHWPKKKIKKDKVKTPKSPSLVKLYFTENHDKFCPPIAFVDPNDTEVRV